MDFPLALLLLFLLLFFSYLCVTKSKKKNTDAPPEPAGALPVIGHLHLLLRSPRPVPHLLADMADTLGPVFLLRLGSRRTLIISSHDAAKQCFTANDKALASRPSNAAAHLLGYDRAMFGFSPYGPYWRSIRRFAVEQLLSHSRLTMLKHILEAEIDTSLNELKACGCGGVDMKKWFGDVNFNIVLRMVAGKRFFGSGGGTEEAWRFRTAVMEFFRLIFAFVPGDMIPAMEWADVGGYGKRMRKAAAAMDELMAGLVEEHREKRKRRAAAGEEGGDEDFMDVMLSAVDGGGRFGDVDGDTVVKATSLALILGGTDTTTTALSRVLVDLITSPDSLKRVQSELDEQVGKTRVVTEPDIKNLVYLQAVIKESFRLTPPAELLIPRETIKDCTVAGFRVPAGTQVMVNAWKLQRDPRVWSEPTEFRPERFLASHVGVDVRGHNFELLPFGTGRRSCPGTAFALQVMHLTLARLIQGFEVRVAGNERGNVGKDLGALGSDSGPLMVDVVPRLPPELYQNS